MKLKGLLAGMVLSLLTALPASAHPLVYVVTLNGASEVPVNTSAGTGTATITFDLDLLTMRVQLSFADLSGTTTASHIHCCTAVAGAGTVGVATMTPTFVGFPLGVTSSAGYDQTFDMNSASSYNAAFIASHGGTVGTAFQALLDGFAAGAAYFNVHSSFAPGGEIRGFLLPTPVPKTSASAMLRAGPAALGVAARRRG
jgi:hypothetical protein